MALRGRQWAVKSSFLADDGHGGQLMDWPRILAYITGTVDQELLLRNEYLVAENRILREQINGRLPYIPHIVDAISR